MGAVVSGLGSCGGGRQGHDDRNYDDAPAFEAVAGQQGTSGGEEIQMALTRQLSRADFVNQIVKHMWPGLSDYIRTLIIDKVEPAVKSSVSSVLGAPLWCDRTYCTLGNRYLELHNVVAQKKCKNIDNAENIRLTCDLEWDGDCSLYLRYAGVGFGITNITLSGRLTVELVQKSPLRPPFFSGLRIFFAEQPELSLDSQGALAAASVVSWGQLKEVIRGVILGQLMTKMVSPNRICAVFDRNAQPFVVKDPSPDGILWFSVYRAEDLLGGYLSGSPDPYVELTCGGESFTSPLRQGTTSPKFSDAKGRPWTVPLRITSPGQQTVRLRILNSGYTGGSVLGVVEWPVSQILTWSRSDLEYSLQDEDGSIGSRGRVKVRAEWSPLEREQGWRLGSQDSCGFLVVGIGSVSHLDHASTNTTFWVEARVSKSHVIGGEGNRTQQESRHLSLSGEDVERAEQQRKKAAILDKYGVSEEDAAVLLQDDPIRKLRRQRAQAAGGDEGKRADPVPASISVVWDEALHFCLETPRTAFLELALMSQEVDSEVEELGTCRITVKELSKEKGQLRHDTFELKPGGPELSASFSLQYFGKPGAGVGEVAKDDLPTEPSPARRALLRTVTNRSSGAPLIDYSSFPTPEDRAFVVRKFPHLGMKLQLGRIYKEAELREMCRDQVALTAFLEDDAFFEQVNMEAPPEEVASHRGWFGNSSSSLTPSAPDQPKAASRGSVSSWFRTIGQRSSK